MYSVNDLIAFAAIIEKEGVSAAAIYLDLSPATVSHRLAKLEEYLGVQLFHRDSRHLAPTSEGVIFYEHIEEILASLKSAEFALGNGIAIKGTLRITLAPWVLDRYILPKLADFVEQYPDLNLDFVATDRTVNLVEEGLDAAVRVGSLADSSLLAQKVTDNSRIICASASYLKGKPSIQSIADLSEHAWVCLPWQKEWILKTSSGGLEAMRGKTQITVSNADSLTQAALSGLGIAVKSRLAVKAYIENGQLLELLPGALSNELAPLWLVRPYAGRHSRKVDAFFNFIKQLEL